VALMGDLLYVRCPPGFQHGDPREWRRIIRRVRELDLDVLVPGHGPVGGAGDLDVEHDYLLHVEALAQSVLDGERTREAALREPLPPPLAALAGRHVLAANLDVLLGASPAGAQDAGARG
jgi:hypothetical protein